MGVRQAGSRKVTPAMIEAGVAEFRKWQEGSDYNYRAFVTRLFRAMLSAQPKALRPVRRKRQSGR